MSASDARAARRKLSKEAACSWTVTEHHLEAGGMLDVASKELMGLMCKLAGA